MRNSPTLKITAEAFDQNGSIRKSDMVVVESALDMRIHHGAGESRLAITLRTPGSDEALISGYLNAEGIIRIHEKFRVERLNKDCVIAYLDPDKYINPKILSRSGVMFSSCGLCGKTFIEALTYLKDNCREVNPVPYTSEWSGIIQNELKNKQKIFEQTGGLHAAALFSTAGKCRYFDEDIGRHNAVDKVIGAAILDGADTSGMILWTSARAGFELVQKAIMSNAGMLISVGASSSLAIETAEAFNLTLVSFARGNSCTVYHQGDL